VVAVKIKIMTGEYNTMSFNIDKSIQQNIEKYATLSCLPYHYVA
jgi:hypothetical protein